MKKIEFDLTKYQTPISKATNRRAAEIEPFVTRLNNSRVAAGYRPLTPGFYTSKMSHIPTDDLHAFYQKLDQSKNFGSLWWYYCCPKKK